MSGCGVHRIKRLGQQLVPVRILAHEGTHRPNISDCAEGEDGPGVVGQVCGRQRAYVWQGLGVVDVTGGQLKDDFTTLIEADESERLEAIVTGRFRLRLTFGRGIGWID